MGIWEQARGQEPRTWALCQGCVTKSSALVLCSLVPILHFTCPGAQEAGEGAVTPKTCLEPCRDKGYSSVAPRDTLLECMPDHVPPAQNPKQLPTPPVLSAVGNPRHSLLSLPVLGVMVCSSWPLPRAAPTVQSGSSAHSLPGKLALSAPRLSCNLRSPSEVLCTGLVQLS